MTPREWSLVKRLIVLVVLTALFPLAALGYRLVFNADLLSQVQPNMPPVIYTLIPGSSDAAPLSTLTPTPVVIVVPSGWNQYALADQNFAIALPAKWQRLPVDPQELAASLQTIRQSNPELATVLGERGPQLMSSGVKFWAFDLDPDSLKGKFATNLTITHQTLPNQVSFDAYVLVNVNQIDQLATKQGAVNQQRTTLGNLPAEKIQYNLLVQASDGTALTSAITQYLVLNGEDAYVLTYATRAEQLDQYSTTFDTSAATFRLLAP